MNNDWLFFLRNSVSEVCDNGPVGMLVFLFLFFFFTKQTLSFKDYMEILLKEIACLGFASK